MTGDGILIKGPAFAANFNIQSTLSGSTTEIDTDEVAGGGGEFNVGSNAPDSGGVLDDIAGPLLLDSGTGQDSTTIDDSGSNSARTVTLNSSEVTGLGAGGITYVDMRQLNVTLGSGNDTLTVAATDGTSTAIGTVRAMTWSRSRVSRAVSRCRGAAAAILSWSAVRTAPFSPRAGSVSLVGGSGGNNRVSTSGDVDFTLANRDLSLSNGDSFGLQSIQQAVLTGGVDNHTFDVSNWTGYATLIGGGGNDTLYSYAHGDQTLSDTSLSCSIGGQFLLSGFGRRGTDRRC